MQIPHIFARLRGILATLYPQESSIRRIVDDAGLDQRRIHFSSQALNTWHSVIAEANFHGSVRTLLEVALHDYPDNEDLASVVQAYLELVTPANIGGDLHPRSPFIGPSPYHTHHADLFHGRDREIAELLRDIIESNSPLWVVNGLSGVGKTSLLRAGLLPALHDANFSVAYTCILDSPETDTIHGIENVFPDFGTEPYDDIPDVVNALVCPLQRPFILIVDQLERCFTLTSNHIEHNNFWRGIARLISGEVRCPTKVILAVRSDWLYAFQDVGPTMSISAFNFLYKLEPLSFDNARLALTGPLTATEFTYEPQLIERILTDLASKDGQVNAPQLQIVGEALYHQWSQSKRTERYLTQADYVALKGARAIIREHLVRIVTALGPNMQLGWQILLQLVGSDGSRVNRRREELQGNLSSEQFDKIIEHFIANALVVREISATDNRPVYTMTHDYLIEEIDDYIKENLSLQGWRTAKHYLDSGLLDWHDSVHTNAEPVFLDEARYLYIWRQKELLGALSDEANRFLLQAALIHGHPSFGFWLDCLPETSQLSMVEVIGTAAFSKEPKQRIRVRQAIHQAVAQHLLSDQAAEQLTKHFWRRFETPEATGQADGSSEAEHRHELAIPVSPQIRRQTSAQLLWLLRSYLSLSERGRVVPVVTSVWTRTHRTQLLSGIGSALVVLLLVATVLRVQAALRGQWHRLSPLSAGPVLAVATAPSDPNLLYVITQRGPAAGDGATLLRRDTMSGSWQILTRNFTDRLIRTLTVTEDGTQRTLYVSLQNGGIIRSTDEGATWQTINDGLLSFSIRSIVADPLQPEILYAASDQRRGVYESQDGGDSWQYISGPELFGVSIFAMAYTNDEEGALLVGTDDGRILARSRGTTAWRPLMTLPGIGTITIIAPEPQEGHTIYAGTSNGTWLISENGANPGWRSRGRLPEIYSISSIAVIAGHADHVFLNAESIGGNVTWRSMDAGETWQRTADNTFTREQLTLYTHERAPNLIWGAGVGGLFTSRDQGLSWVYDSELGAPLAAIDKIVVGVEDHPAYAIVGGAIFVNRSLLGTSTNGQNDWQRGAGLPALAVNDVVVEPDDTQRAYAAVFLTNQWPIFMTEDGGKNWRKTIAPTTIDEGFFTFMRTLEIGHSEQGSMVYGGSNQCGLVASRDHGETWAAFGHEDCVFGDTEPQNILDIAADPHTVGKLYVAADRNRIYTTVDEGETWSVSQIALSGAITSLAVDSVIANRLYALAGSNGFWRSDDGGVTWISYSQGLAEKELVDFVVLPAQAGTIIVASYDGEIWRTADAGNTWRSITENLSTTDITSMYRLRQNRLILSSSVDGLYEYVPGSLSKIWP